MDAEHVAEAVLAAAGGRAPLAPFPGLTLEAAYRAAARIRERREARGERVVGRKIGFTNRTIWDEYGVHAPIWGYVYDRTLHDLAEPAHAAEFWEPRIEPEIAFGLAKPLRSGMSFDKVAEAVAWMAHGFEIVQSPYPGWRFCASDTVAAFGLHGGLWLGPRRPLAPGEREKLENFEVVLRRNGRPADRGQARHVLDGPLHALRHLAETLAEQPEHPPLAAGEIVTTGTLTRAFPVAPGDVWETELSGLDLPGARLAVVG